MDVVLSDINTCPYPLLLLLCTWFRDLVQQCMAQVQNTDLGIPLESIESTQRSACIKKLNMATPLRCFGVLGQSVP